MKYMAGGYETGLVAQRTTVQKFKVLKGKLTGIKTPGDSPLQST